MHYLRWYKHGDPSAQVRAAKGTHRPWVSSKGYVFVYCPDHPLAKPSGYVQEHRMVAWNAGLFDDPSWIVHHKNEVRDDNRVENLEPMTHAAHQALHARTKNS